MSRTLVIAAIAATFFMAALTPAASEEGYTFISTERGPAICLGTWVPPRDTGLAGVCDGQIMSFPQLSAISGKQSVERLDQLLSALEAIDQKMAVNNEQIGRLIDATVTTQVSIDRQVSQVSDFLRETITQKFNALPRELLANESFREELAKLKEDILAEVGKRYPPGRQTPPAK